MEPFEFSAPKTVADALKELSDEEAIALGGGTATVIMMKQHLLSPKKIVWLGHIGELRDITVTNDGGLRIGATATLDQLIQSPEVQSHYPALSRAASGVGNARVRAVATMGGNLLHADPCQDLPPLLLALGAVMELDGPEGRRTQPVTGDFFVDYMQTAIAEHDLLLSVTLPSPPAGLRATYLKFTPRSQDDFATVGVAAAVEVAADGMVKSARVALSGVGATPIVVDEIPGLLSGRRPERKDLERAGDAAAETCEPWDDERGSEAYKRAMAKVWTRRALEEVLR